MPSAVSRAPERVLEVLALGLALERLHGGLVEPVGEEDAAVRGRQRVRLPLLEVVLVVEPLIEQLPKVDFDLRPMPRSIGCTWSVSLGGTLWSSTPTDCITGAFGRADGHGDRVGALPRVQSGAR